MVSAFYLKNNHGISDGNLSNKVSFADLHPGAAIPWEALLCDHVRLDKKELAEKFNLPSSYTPAGRPLNEPLGDPDWLSLSPEPGSAINLQHLPVFLQEQVAKVPGKNKRKQQGVRLKFRIVVGSKDTE